MYWFNKAALLDPRCFQYAIGPTWSLTVPANETWFMLNAWWLEASPGSWWFHRPLDVNRAHALPAGTAIKPVPGKPGFAYYARPSLLDDPRYTDPESLYYERIERLNTLPLLYSAVKIPIGSPPGYYGGAMFDWGDAQSGILRHTSTHDACWTILAGNLTNGFMNALNTLNEISDNHTMRSSEPTLCPINRSLWNGIWVQQASRSGDAASVSKDEGHGVVAWSRLPPDW